MNAAEALAAIRQAFLDVSQLDAALVNWQGAEFPYVPYDQPIIRLNVTTLRRESQTRETQDFDEEVTTFETPYLLTIRALAQHLKNDGSALESLLKCSELFESSVWRDTWNTNGLAIVDTPLNPTRLDYTQDGRNLAVFASDTIFRVVLSRDLALVTSYIETVNGTGTLNPGAISVPFGV